MKKRNKKISSKLSFSARQDFFFLAHNPEYPPKILPANAGPGDFDGLRCFSPDGEVGGLKIETFPPDSMVWFFEKSPVQVRDKTRRVVYKG
jgi:hypothetical protein